jgi:hypothetical protein
VRDHSTWFWYDKKKTYIDEGRKERVAGVILLSMPNSMYKEDSYLEERQKFNSRS